jgi:hypothetical protein
MQADLPDAARTNAGADALGRRDALLLLASLAALLPAGFAEAQTAIDRASFLRASSLVTGVPPDGLSDLVDPLLAAFRDQGPALGKLLALGRTADLAAAVHGTPLEGLCRQLAAAWYTGTDGTSVISYEEALSWKVAGFAAVPGQCAGAFGAWADPPATN